MCIAANDLPLWLKQTRLCIRKRNKLFLSVGAPGRRRVNPQQRGRECRLYAEHCADRARRQSDPQLRDDYIDMQRRWLALARSYEFAEQLEFLSDVETRNKEARRIFEDAAA